MPTRANSSSKSRAGSSSKSSSRSGSSRSARGTSAKTTTDHDEIRRFVEARGGHPAWVRGTGGKGDAGLLRVDYPGFSGQDRLQEISWDEFFDQFDNQNLAFLYQAKTTAGDPSRFSKFISRDNADGSRSSAPRSQPGDKSRSRPSGKSGPNKPRTRAGSRSRK